jgi:putative aldouronate transport system permease protein
MTTAEAKAPALAKKNSLWVQVLKNKHIYILLLPAILAYLIFHYAPMGGLIIAFQKFSVTKGIMGSTFVGLKNFEAFLSDIYFWRLLRNTLLINFWGLVFGFPMPIILALLLNEIKNDKFKKSVQTITYMPHFLSVVVVSSLVLTFVSSQGFINSMIEMFGGERIAFMSDPKYFRTIYVISDIWQQIGWNSILYISALSGIDQELYEAATIDGAGRWGKLWHITIPGILGTIMITLIMRIGRMLTLGYDKIILLYNPSIYETADVISTYVYRRGLLNADYSYSAAVGMFNSVFNFIFLMTANTFSKKATGSGLW